MQAVRDGAPMIAFVAPYEEAESQAMISTLSHHAMPVPCYDAARPSSDAEQTP